MFTLSDKCNVMSSKTFSMVFDWEIFLCLYLPRQTIQFEIIYQNIGIFSESLIYERLYENFLIFTIIYISYRSVRTFLNSRDQWKAQTSRSIHESTNKIVLVVVFSCINNVSAIIRTGKHQFPTYLMLCLKDS